MYFLFTSTSEHVRFRMCIYSYVSVDICAPVHMCLRLCVRASESVSTNVYVNRQLSENLSMTLRSRTYVCKRVWLRTSMSLNEHVYKRVCIFDRACQRTYMSANVCECVCKRVRLRTCLWSVNSAFSFSLPAAPAAIRAWGLSRESLVIIFASPGVRHLASGSAGCPITQGSLRTSDMMNHKYLRVGIG